MEHDTSSNLSGVVHVHPQYVAVISAKIVLF